MVIRTISRLVAVRVCLLCLGVLALVVVARPAEAADPSPSTAETARLLGYMWGDGSEEGGIWDVNGPSGTSSLIEELVEAHGGTWTNRQKLQFRLPAPYDWAAWKDGLPDDNQAVRDAVRNPHFLAALLETEASVGGQVYDQSRCCVPGYTRGRLTELRQLLRDRGFATATFVEFNNVDSGKITIAASEWDELRAQHRFVCPVENSDIRLPGGSDHQSYGDIRWFGPNTRWASVVRNDCVDGEPVPAAQPLAGTCTVGTENVDTGRVSWTFTLGDAVIRRNGRYIETVSGRDGSWTEQPGDGTHDYEVRLRAFGQETNSSCGSITIGGGGGVGGPCVASPSGGGVLVDWDDFGKDSYPVRRNGSWVTTVSDGATSAVLAGSVADAWEVRYRSNGTVVTVPCVSGEPPVDGPCAVSAIADGVRIGWDGVAGIDTYQIRRGGSWVATVDGVTSYDDVGGVLGANYSVRYRTNGLVVDLSCAP